MDKELLGEELRNDLQDRIMKGEKQPSTKVFKLLYQATRDGCSVEDFQRNCKEKTPTLTVLYGSTGTIFGGYTSKPWTSKGKAVIRDPLAFLFYCHQNNHMETLEMKPKNYGWAITCNSDTGPSFGGGNFRHFDLQVFKKLGKAKKFECKDGYFRLNGSLNLNCTHVSNENSFRRESINAGALYVKDVEVYEVCKDTKDNDIEVPRGFKRESTSHNDRKGAMLDALKKHIQTNIVNKNVNFRLLFHAKKDGCTAESFHKKCDAIGRTLTVMYGRKYFYGGFTAVNWQSGNQVRKHDTNAFLFCQNVAKNDDPLYLTYSNGKDAIFCDSTYGPTFGCSSWSKTPDFQAFRGNAPTEQYEYGYFKPSSSVNINNTYKHPQVRSEYDFHGGDKYVYDIEVFAVEDAIEYFPSVKVDDCKARIAKYCTDQYGIKSYNILLAGPIGVGKTSFCRSLDVAYAGKLQNEVGPIASQGDSVTNRIFRYTIQPKEEFHINMYDIRGVDDTRGYLKEFGPLLEGKLIDNYQFPDAMTDVSNDFLKDAVNVKPDDRIHALCIVLDATKVDIMTNETTEHIKWITKTAYERDIQITVVATFMDDVCPMVKRDLKTITNSLVAKDLMGKIAEFTGTTTDNIFPVINYTSDTKIEETKNLLALQAFGKMVEQAASFIKKNTVQHRTEYVHTLLKSLGERELNVLCVGKVKAGKSFFIDSVMSTMSKKLTNKASGGLLRDTDDSSRGTQKFLWHTLEITDERKYARKTNVKFLDMPGFDNDNAVDIEQIRNVIEGHCPKNYALVNRIENDAAEYIQNPKWHNKVHVVCFVVDDRSLTTPQNENRMLESIISDILVPNNIPYVVVLTKTDKVDKLTNAISKVSKAFGVAEGHVYTVQNYLHEKSVIEAIDIPVLKVLQAIMEEGTAYYQTHAEESEDYRKGSNDE